MKTSGADTMAIPSYAERAWATPRTNDEAYITLPTDLASLCSESADVDSEVEIEECELGAFLMEALQDHDIVCDDIKEEFGC